MECIFVCLLQFKSLVKCKHVSFVYMSGVEPQASLKVQRTEAPKEEASHGEEQLLAGELRKHLRHVQGFGGWFGGWVFGGWDLAELLGVWILFAGFGGFGLGDEGLGVWGVWGLWGWVTWGDSGNNSQALLSSLDSCGCNQITLAACPHAERKAKKEEHRFTSLAPYYETILLPVIGKCSLATHLCHTRAKHSPEHTCGHIIISCFVIVSKRLGASQPP